MIETLVLIMSLLKEGRGAGLFLNYGKIVCEFMEFCALANCNDLLGTLGSGLILFRLTWFSFFFFVFVLEH